MQERMSKNHPADTVKESDTLPTVAKLQIYKSVILSHLTYCHLVPRADGTFAAPQTLID